MTIKVKVTLDPVTKKLDPADYQEAWEEKCDDDGTGPEDEGGSYPPMPDDFVIERFTSAVEEGNEDLNVLFESAGVTVETV